MQRQQPLVHRKDSLPAFPLGLAQLFIHSFGDWLRGRKLLSEPLYAAAKAGRLISFDGSDNKIQIGCNIRPLPQLVNIDSADKSRPGAAVYPSNDWRVISTTRPEPNSVNAVELNCKTPQFDPYHDRVNETSI